MQWHSTARNGTQQHATDAQRNAPTFNGDATTRTDIQRAASTLNEPHRHSTNRTDIQRTATTRNGRWLLTNSVCLQGKQKSRARQRVEPAIEAHSWRARLQAWKAELSVSSGETILPMAARLLLMMTFSFALETGSTVKYTAKRGFQGMTKVFASVSCLTGVSVSYLTALFKSVKRSASGILNYTVSDNSIRGRGSPNVDRKKLRKLTPRHLSAIEKFIDHSNSSDGCGSVRNFIGRLSLPH